MKLALRSVYMGLVIAILTACGGSNPTQEGAVAPQRTSDYLIGPGDVLSVNVWNNPEVSKSVPVRPDGRISTPLVEDMQAVGKSPADLARDIEQVLGEYIRSPKVTVIVTNFVGTYQEQIKVIGKAVNPRAVPYRDSMSLLDVIIEVGGLAEYAAGNRARVVRWDGDTQKEIRVRLDDLLNKGRINENILMKPGDVLIIPEARF